MTLGGSCSEFGLIERYFKGPRWQALEQGADVLVGNGDDGALLQVVAGQSLVVSTDTLVAGRHFPFDTSAFDVGWKAVAVNLSDLAAMGAEPVALTLALSLPAADPAWLSEFADGFYALAARYGVPLVGGDTSRSPHLSVTLTALGQVPVHQALRRSGARCGDVVMVSGTLGDAALALRDRTLDAALTARLNRPEPRLALGQLLRGAATSALDVSDGLAQDAGHIARASGVDVVIQVDHVPVHGRVAALPSAERWSMALAGGDDYELCFTVPPSCVGVVTEQATALGTLIAPIGVCRRPEQPNSPQVRLYERGNPVTLERSGYQHFGQ